VLETSFYGWRLLKGSVGRGWQLVNVEELARRGVRRAKLFVGVRRSGCASGSGELIVDPSIVNPSPVTVFNKQQSLIILFQ
jgi:hypothetical protein